MGSEEEGRARPWWLPAGAVWILTAAGKRGPAGLGVLVELTTGKSPGPTAQPGGEGASGKARPELFIGHKSM